MKKNIAIFTLCSVLSAAITVFWTLKYIMFGYATAYLVFLLSGSVLLCETLLSIYATTGKSLGIVWAMRKYGAKSTILATASIVLSTIATATYGNLIIGAIIIFLSGTSFACMAAFFTLQTKEVIQSFQS